MLTAYETKHLRNAIALSRDASACGDNPYGAVLGDGDRAIATAKNTQYSQQDCTAHAEINLVREASRRFDRETLARFTVYASGEPCAMCAAAIYWANIRRVVYALPREAMQALEGGKSDALVLDCREVFTRGSHQIEVVGPLLKDEAGAVLQAHYRAV
jgi:tRNA(adenine34) deaminase